MAIFSAVIGQAYPRYINVIAGLDLAIHPSLQKRLAKKMDARVKPAHDVSYCTISVTT